MKIISTLKAAKEQNEMIEKINKPGNFLLLEEKSIKEKKAEGIAKKHKIKHRDIKFLQYKKGFKEWNKAVW